MEPVVAKYKLPGLASGRASLTTVGRRFEPSHIHLIVIILTQNAEFDPNLNKGTK